MIASIGFNIKFHEWDTFKPTGFYNLPKRKTDEDRQTGKSAAKGNFTEYKDIEWNRDGNRLVAVPFESEEKCVIFCPEFANETIKPYGISIGNVTCAQFSRIESDLLALGTLNGHVVLYNIANRKSNVLLRLGSPIKHLAFSSSDEYLAIYCEKGPLYVMFIGFGITSTYYTPYNENIVALATHPTDPAIMAGGTDLGMILLWNVSTCDLVMSNRQHVGTIIDITFSGFDNTLATIGVDNKMSIFDLRVYSCILNKQFNEKLTSLAQCPASYNIALGTEDGHILTVDRRCLDITRAAQIARGSPIRIIRFSLEIMANSEWLLAAHCANGSEESGSSMKLTPSSEFSSRHKLLDDAESQKLINAIYNLGVNVHKRMGSNHYPGNYASGMLGIVHKSCFSDLATDLNKAVNTKVFNYLNLMKQRFLNITMLLGQEFASKNHVNQLFSYELKHDQMKVFKADGDILKDLEQICQLEQGNSWIREMFPQEISEVTYSRTTSHTTHHASPVYRPTFDTLASRSQINESTPLPISSAEECLASALGSEICRPLRKSRLPRRHENQKESHHQKKF